MMTVNIASKSEIEARHRALKTLAKVPVVLYGAGLHASEIEGYLGALGVEIAGCFVDDAYVGGKHRTKCPVESLSRIKARLPEFRVIVAQCNDPEQVVRRLSLEGATDRHPPKFIDCRFWKEFQGLTREHVESNRDRYASVHDLLGDDLSRKTFEQFINAKLLRSPLGLFELWCRHQYFPDDLAGFQPSTSDVFVDGGAFTGDTLADFVASNGGQGCREYDAFEADPSSAELLSRFVRERGFAFARVIPVGLWSEPAVLGFIDGCGTSSVISSEGGSQIKVDRLDRFELAPTFIKLDIEGAEAEALRGARETIQRHRPKLAVCLYHKLEHLTEIPLLVHELNPDYHIYLRLHRPYTEELVLYALEKTKSPHR